MKGLSKLYYILDVKLPTTPVTTHWILNMGNSSHFTKKLRHGTSALSFLLFTQNLSSLEAPIFLKYPAFIVLFGIKTRN